MQKVKMQNESRVAESQDVALKLRWRVKVEMHSESRDAEGKSRYSVKVELQRESRDAE